MRNPSSLLLCSSLCREALISDRVRVVRATPWRGGVARVKGSLDVEDGAVGL